MRRVLRLAKRGRGRVSPNPLVGAVILKENKIIGQGFHAKFGEAHAEVRAIASAEGELKGATLYVNLEPCSHHGKQPPCVEKIVQHGIKKVVIGTTDRNPLVQGRGIAFLRRHGVTVQVGVLEDKCRELNEAFFKHVTTGVPLVTLKVAQTVDGRIATAAGGSRWITSEKARRMVHKLRSEQDAVLVGVGTVLADDPQLTVRLTSGRHPRRFVVDSRLRLPLRSRLLSDELAEQTVVATTERASPEKIQAVEATGATVWKIPADEHGRVSLRALLRRMGEAGITSVLVEGGSEVFSSFLRNNLADRVAIFVAPKILGDGLCSFHDSGFHDLEQSIRIHDMVPRRVGPDVLLTGRIHVEAN
ncbi:MAG: bifunctional diaminohydroxyphosphoribosylaminopyrimidine deaminase/5-amino-6-(5-phosphoribosylamino)uracil reductase RibD [Calditrichaeota bacterium]|nr:MAG: bifunctional diaminohydroxyphosphoribosylaminopyrimidine deaminase/5-amino-6-(5-phosphoribosylamino)uracil reductase RibD [Calditrichota bacterium]